MKTFVGTVLIKIAKLMPWEAGSRTDYRAAYVFIVVVSFTIIAACIYMPKWVGVVGSLLILAAVLKGLRDAA